MELSTTPLQRHIHQARRLIGPYVDTTFKRILVGVATSAVAIILYLAKPPRAFPNRLQLLREEDTVIDNSIYNQAEWFSSWWSTKDSHLALLQKLNPVRIPYFDRIWSRNCPRTSGQSAHDARLFLDAGCGGGICSEALAKLGYNMIGVDISEASLEVARAHARENMVSNVSYQVGSIYKLPFPDEHFDGIVSSDVFEHLHDLETAVREIKRVLKPGGIFVFDTINRTWLSWIFSVLFPQHILRILPSNVHDWRMFITPLEMRQLMERQGFEVADIQNEFRGMSITFRVWEMLRKFSLLGGLHFEETRDLPQSYLGWARKPS